MPATEDDYVCPLDEFTLDIAKKELNEDPKERMSALATFRDWILQQPHLKCPMDTVWLLWFLRTAKFSQLKARTMLTGYLTIKTQTPTWQNDLDMTESKVQAFLDIGYLLVLPGYDKLGRKVLLAREGAIDTKSKLYDVVSLCRCMYGLLMHLGRDEKTQVHGIVYLMDCSDFSMKHQLYFGMDNMKKMMKSFIGNYPGRYKGFHYYNMNPVYAAMMEIFMPLMGKKLRDRSYVESNMESVYKTIPMKMLPREYLPDDYKGECAGTMQQLISSMKEELTSPESRQYILTMSKAEFGCDKAKKPSDVPMESFRKLNVD